MEDFKALEALQRIKQVDPPPFLFAKIEQKIATFKGERMPIRWTISLAASIVLLISLNLTVLSNQKTISVENSSDLNSLVSALNMDTNNQLYRD